MPYSTPDLCDRYPDLVHVAESIFRDYGAQRSFGGKILTIKCYEDNSLVKQLASEPGEGRVMVVDGGGSLRKALLGDMIASEAVKNGWSGFIIFGCIRDAELIASMPIGVKALNTIPLKTERRGLGDLQIPVHFAGVDFIPGQYVYADSNGIVVAASMLE